MGAVVLRHSTLVPGWSLEPECDPHSPEEPSIVLERTTACLQIEHSILGTIEVIGDEVGEDPLTSTSGTASSTPPATTARPCPPRTAATRTPCCTRTAPPSSARSTPTPCEIAENSIFTGRLHVARRGIGCLRYSYVPTGSRTPRRHRCQPDLAGPSRRPRYGRCSRRQRYGTPCVRAVRRSGLPADEIRRGADDGAEMGAFHDLYRPQREDGLRARLAEYTPAGTDAGIFFVTVHADPP